MSQFQDNTSAERQIRIIEDRIREQEARLRSMIVRGAPTQSAEDALRKLYATLREVTGADPSHPDPRALHRGLLDRRPRRMHGDKWPR